MPQLWNASIEAHRAAVTAEIKRAAWQLVHAHGLPALSMSQIADEVGISRATLYRYFPDVEAILVAWHADQVEHHLAALGEAASAEGSPIERLEAILNSAAAIAQEIPHSPELATLLHGGDDIAHAEQRLLALLEGVITAAVTAGQVRSDLPPADLARYCLYAVTAAGSAAPERRDALVQVVLAGLR